MPQPKKPKKPKTKTRSGQLAELNKAAQAITERLRGQWFEEVDGGAGVQMPYNWFNGEAGVIESPLTGTRFRMVPQESAAPANPEPDKKPAADPVIPAKNGRMIRLSDPDSASDQESENQ